MRFALCNETFQSPDSAGKYHLWPVEDGFNAAAEAGYTGIEIAPFTLAEHPRDVSAARRKELRRHCEKLGMPVIGLHWLLVSPKGLHVAHADPAIRQKTLGVLMDLVTLCSDLGGQVLVFGSPFQRSTLDGWDSAETWRRACEAFQKVAEVAGRAGCTLALEPLTTAETNLMLSSAEGRRMVESVAHPACKLHLDVKAMSPSAEPVASQIRAHADLLTHFHANDANKRGPGFGNTDFVPILQALKDVNYAGWVSVEVFDYTPDPITIARESLAHLKKCEAAAGKKSSK
ncbi:MAG TPA: sugar phosphate isomerase/epimerase family protein [Planctomycetota bacterium]|nr:sugar phosphate isomerase/epimerase family protein [Planctomycetota bacterium]